MLPILRFPCYFETPLFRTFIHFPWDIEIAGFNCIGVSQSKILIDAVILFQIKPWEYEKMKNSDEKANIGAFRNVKKPSI